MGQEISSLAPFRCEDGALPGHAAPLLPPGQATFPPNPGPALLPLAQPYSPCCVLATLTPHLSLAQCKCRNNSYSHPTAPQPGHFVPLLLPGFDPLPPSTCYTHLLQEGPRWVWRLWLQGKISRAGPPEIAKSQFRYIPHTSQSILENIQNT